MIRKTASSEIFDIYASKMISKRAQIIKLSSISAALEKLFLRLMVGAEKVGAKELDAVALRFAGSSAAEKSLKSISLATADDIEKSIKSLFNSSRIKESSDVILSKANNAGYSGFSDVDDFLAKFSDDFKSMGEEYSILGASPKQPEVLQFYNDNKKTIEFYNLLKNDSELSSAIAKDEALGEKILKNDGKIKTRAEAEAENLKAPEDPKKPSEVPDKPESFPVTVTKFLATSVISNIVPIATLIALYNYGGDIVEKVASWFSSGDLERHMENADNAVDCINAINIKPGSPASAAKEKIIRNLEKYSKYSQIGDGSITDKEQLIRTMSSAGIAAEELTGDEEVNGSIKNFISLLSKDPDKNLVGYSIANITSWDFMKRYYESQINCLLSAVDAIQQYCQIIKEASEAQETESKKNQDNPPQATTTGGATTSDAAQNSTNSVGLLENMVGAMSDAKIYNVPGLKHIFLNEKKIVSELVSSYGASEASRLISEANPNIGLILKTIKNPDLKETVNANTISEYKVLQDLGRAIVFGARAVGKSKPVSSTLTSQSKIKEDKMKKESKSINNHQLIRKAAETRVSYFGDANLGLKDQLTKSYYAGLTGMYNEQPTKRPSDYKDLYGFQKETGHDLMAESHPKSVTLADAMGKGGLVENNLEQQQKSIYVATNTPSGNFQSKYAQTVSYLEKLAKAADSQGKEQVSRIINQTIQKLK